MTVASTAKRRRRQAVLGWRYMARIGRGNNNRPFYSTHSAEVMKKREADKVERQKLIMARKGRRR